LKCKTVNQYKKLLSEFTDNQYTIEVKRIQQLQGNLIIIIAQPI
jgi:hypothetical protein